MNRSIFYLVLSLILLAAAVAGYITYYHTVSVLSDKVTALRAEIAVRNIVPDTVPTSVDSATLAEAKQQVANYFVDPTDIAAFLGELQSIGTTTGAHVAVVSVSEDAKSHGRLTLALQATGSFDAVARTVGAIEYSPYDLAVSNLTLSVQPQPADKTAPIGWTATMTISVGTTATSKTVAPTQAQP
jgi:hypothetical protein